MKLEIGTQERLESIIELCVNIQVKAAFYKAVGQQEKAAEYEREILWGREQSDNLTRIDRLERRLLYAAQFGPMEERPHLAQELYDNYLQKENYTLALGLGRKFLSLSADTVSDLREKILFQAMTMSGGLYISDSVYIHASAPLNTRRFLQEIEKTRKGMKITFPQWSQILYMSEDGPEIPASRAEQIGRKAYEHLMASPPQSFSVEENYLQAGLIARYFGWQQEMDNAGRKIAEQIVTMACAPTSENCAHAALDKLQLTDETTHLLALQLFKLHMGGRQAEKVRATYHLPDEMAKPAIEEAYGAALTCGNFSQAIALRSSYGRFITDDKVSLADLRTLNELLQSARADEVL